MSMVNERTMNKYEREAKEAGRETCGDQVRIRTRGVDEGDILHNILSLSINRILRIR